MSNSTASITSSRDAQLMRVLTDINQQYRDLALWRSDMVKWRVEEIVHKSRHLTRQTVNAYDDAIEAEYKLLKEERQYLSSQTEQIKAAERERIGVQESNRDYHRYDPPPLYASLPPAGSAPERSSHLTAIISSSLETVNDGIRAITHPPERPTHPSERHRDLVLRTAGAANVPTSRSDFNATVGRLDERIDDLDTGNPNTFMELVGRIDALEARIDALEARIDASTVRDTSDLAARGNVNLERPRDLVARTANAPTSHRDLDAALDSLADGIDASRARNTRDLAARGIVLPERSSNLFTRSTANAPTSYEDLDDAIVSGRSLPESAIGYYLAVSKTIRGSEAHELNDERLRRAVNEYFDATISSCPRIAPSEWSESSNECLGLSEPLIDSSDERNVCFGLLLLRLNKVPMNQMKRMKFD